MTTYEILLPKEKYEFEKLTTSNFNARETIQVKHIEKTNVDEAIKIEKSYHKNRYSFEISDAEIECFLRHREAWKLLTESELEYALIIEENFDQKIQLDQIKESIAKLPRDWDIFFPYDNETSIHNQTTLRKDLLNPNHQELGIIEPYFLGYYWGSTIYFISKKGALKLLNINVVRQRVEDEILFQSFNDSLNTYVEEVPWYNSSNQSLYYIKEREEKIQKAIFLSTAWTPIDTLLIRKILKILSEVADVLNIDLLLQGGSLLGYVRLGRILPWDDDIDIGIEEKNVGIFLEYINKETKLNFDHFIEERTNIGFYKFWLDEGTMIPNHPYTFPFVDLWLYNTNEKDIVFKNGIVCPNSALKNLESIVFEGSVFQIPFNFMECLDSRYGTWREYVRVYPYSHKHEKSMFFPLRTKITVNENGRIIYPDLNQFDI